MEPDRIGSSDGPDTLLSFETSHLSLLSLAWLSRFGGGCRLGGVGEWWVLVASFVSPGADVLGGGVGGLVVCVLNSGREHLHASLDGLGRSVGSTHGVDRVLWWCVWSL